MVFSGLPFSTKMVMKAVVFISAKGIQYHSTINSQIVCKFSITCIFFVLNYLLFNTFAMNFFTKWFLKPHTQANSQVMKKYLIVGLGNIGAEYVNTRHNIGFKAVDFMANESGATFETVKLGALTEIKVKNKIL